MYIQTPPLKIVVIGDSGVGKTSLLNRYIDNYFTTDHNSTIGVEFKAKTFVVNGENCTFHIWDTAGQERFRAITSTYYRGAHGVILCYDTSNMETFKNMEEWLGEVNHYIADAQILMVGTKTDKRREVPYNMAAEYARKNNVTYVETSSKNNTNIHGAFDTLIKNMYKAQNSLGERETVTIGTQQKSSHRCCGGESLFM